MYQQEIIKKLGQAPSRSTLTQRMMDDATFFLKTMPISPEKHLATKEKAAIQEDFDQLKARFLDASSTENDRYQSAMSILVRISQLQKRLGSMQPKLLASPNDELLRALHCEFSALDIQKVIDLLQQGGASLAAEKNGLSAYQLLANHGKKYPLPPELTQLLNEHKHMAMPASRKTSAKSLLGSMSANLFAVKKMPSQPKKYESAMENTPRPPAVGTG